MIKQKIDARYRLQADRSAISGTGLFALEDIPWGVKIMRYKGAKITDAEAERRIRKGATAIMEVGGGENLDGFRCGNGAALINHSRDKANCFLLRDNGKIWIVAGIEGIAAGEELTYDYGCDYYEN